MFAGFTVSPVGCLTYGIDGWIIGGTPIVYQFDGTTTFAVNTGNWHCGISGDCHDGSPTLPVVAGLANMNVGSIK